MKRIALIALALVLAASGLEAATGSATWNGSLTRFWDNDANWTPAQHPADGHTATFVLDAVGAGLPNANLPESGDGTINFVFQNRGGATLSALLDGVDPAAVGNVALAAGCYYVTCDLDITGTLTLGAGSVVVAMADGVTVTGETVTSGQVSTTAGHTVTFTGQITLAAGGCLDFFGYVDANGGIVATGNAAIDFGNTGSLSGKVNADGNTITWMSTGTLTLDEAGTFDPGGNLLETGITVTISAATTIGADFACKGFKTTAALTVSDKTITVGSGGFEDDGGSATAGELTIACSASTAVASWPTVGDYLKTLTIATGATVTLSGNVYAQSMTATGTGTLALNSKSIYIYNATANDFWTCPAGISGTGLVSFYIADDRSNAGDILLGTGAAAVVINYGAGDRTLAVSGSWTSGALNVLGGAAGDFTTLVLNGNSTAGAVTLGKDTVNDRCGRITFGVDKIHTITSLAAAKVDEAGTDNAVTFGGIVRLGGGAYLADLAADFGSAVILGNNAPTLIEGVGAESVASTNSFVCNNGYVFVVQHVDYATPAAPILCVGCTDGSGNGAGVLFYDAIGSRSCMGVGQ